MTQTWRVGTTSWWRGDVVMKWGGKICWLRNLVHGYRRVRLQENFVCLGREFCEAARGQPDRRLPGWNAIWLRRQIKNSQNCWMVSNYGRFCDSRGSVSYGKETESGYHVVSIFGEKFYAHRVVAITFHGPPPDQSAWQVHHRDGDASNNRAENLTYVTSAENVQNSYKNSLRGNAGRAVSRRVLCKNVRTSHVVAYPSIVAAASKLGVSSPTVARSCREGSHIGDFHVEFCLTHRAWATQRWTMAAHDRSRNHAPSARAASQQLRAHQVAEKIRRRLDHPGASNEVRVLHDSASSRPAQERCCYSPTSCVCLFWGRRPARSAMRSTTKTWTRETIVWKTWSMSHDLRICNTTMPTEQEQPQ